MQIWIICVYQMAVHFRVSKMYTLSAFPPKALTENLRAAVPAALLSRVMAFALIWPSCKIGTAQLECKEQRCTVDRCDEGTDARYLPFVYTVIATVVMSDSPFSILSALIAYLRNIQNAVNSQVDQS